MIAGVEPLLRKLILLVKSDGIDSTKLVILPFEFKSDTFDAPLAAWRRAVERTANEIVGGYTTMENQRLFSVFEG